MMALLNTLVQVWPLDLLPLRRARATSANMGGVTACHLRAILFRGVISLALDSAQVDEHRPGHLLDLSKQVDHQVQVVPIHGTYILVSQLLEDDTGLVGRDKVREVVLEHRAGRLAESAPGVPGTLFSSDRERASAFW